MLLSKNAETKRCLTDGNSNEKGWVLNDICVDNRWLSDYFYVTGHI